jgi:hypothetical protein
VPTTSNPHALLWKAKLALGMNDDQFGRAIGKSGRTMSRFWSNEAEISGSTIAQVAPLVFSKNPELARELAAAGGLTLVDLGLVTPTPPVAPAPAPDLRLVDGVICTASDAMSVLPGVARPIVLAIFRRANELGLDVPAVIAALTLGQAPKKRA